MHVQDIIKTPKQKRMKDISINSSHKFEIFYYTYSPLPQAGRRETSSAEPEVE